MRNIINRCSSRMRLALALPLILLVMTQTLLPGSSAIDKGRAATDPTRGNPITTHQRGSLRPDDPLITNRARGGGSDISAFESQVFVAQPKIAFASNRSGNFEIYVMNSDGTNQINLTKNPAGDGEPSFSPDGSKIAFDSSRNRNNEIYVMNADGTNQTRLTSNPAGDGLPAFSPDSSKIAFVSNREGNAEIYVMNADGSNQVRLTNNRTFASYPSFSPDGSKIVFNSSPDGSDYEIYVMNADGSNQINLSNNPAFESDPTFSGDGKIAFVSDRDGNSEIYVMSAGTTTATATSTAQLPPVGFSFAGLTFDIKTTATFTAPVTVCFSVPSVTDPTIFSGLKLLHSKGGVLVDRTTNSDFATKTVCGQVNSLSPFVLVQPVEPRRAKRSTLDGLIALRASPNLKRRVAEELDDVIAHLSASLDPSLWVDGFHLQQRRGERDFDEEKQAVNELRELLADEKSSLAKTTLQQFIVAITDADRVLAL